MCLNWYNAALLYRHAVYPMQNPNSLKTGARRFSTAPMMDWSDRHCRYFWRLLSENALLYTEMVTTGAILHGDNLPRFLGFNEEEHPIALQLGGSNPEDLAKCAKLAEEWHYDEVNLNVGCPSDRVQNNMIGACLMGHPQLVADCIKSMQDIVDIDVTVKHRIGIDDQESYEQLVDFVGTVAETGCNTFIVHARKAILQGLSPKENREIPPLKYDFVYQLKQDFPELEIIINGGIKTHDEISTHLEKVDGVMIGREAYQNPYLLSEVDHKYYQDLNPQKHYDEIISRKDAVRKMFPYIEQQLSQGAYLGNITRHMLGIFYCQRGGKQFRRFISENAHKKGAGLEVLEKSLDLIPDTI